MEEVKRKRSHGEMQGGVGFRAKSALNKMPWQMYLWPPATPPRNLAGLIVLELSGRYNSEIIT